MISRSLALNVENKADTYRILCIEPFGLKYGMESGEAFTIIFEGDENFSFYIGDTSEEIIFTLDKFEQMEIEVFNGKEEIFDKHNLNVL